MDAIFLKSAFQESHYPPPGKTEVAFAGRSNVGKSSLLNILVNRKNLARTSSTPGRTQALNFFLVDGRFYFVDLPGYGYARVSLEVKKSWRGMVGTYLRNRPNLKAVVVIVDIRRNLGEDDRELIEVAGTGREKRHSSSDQGRQAHPKRERFTGSSDGKGFRRNRLCEAHPFFLQDQRRPQGNLGQAPQPDEGRRLSRP